MGPLLSAPAGASKRETTTANLTESTVTHLLLSEQMFVDDEKENNLFDTLPVLLYIELSNSFLIGRKSTANFRNQRP